MIIIWYNCNYDNKHKHKYTHINIYSRDIELMSCPNSLGGYFEAVVLGWLVGSGIIPG